MDAGVWLLLHVVKKWSWWRFKSIVMKRYEWSLCHRIIWMMDDMEVESTHCGKNLLA